MNFFEKLLYCLLVDVVRSTYAKLAHLDFINKKVIELIFKLNVPKFQPILTNDVSKSKLRPFLSKKT